MPGLSKLCLLYLYCFNEYLKLVLAFTPTNTVWGHNAALVGSKIYYTGGVIPNGTIWKDVKDFGNTPNQYATQSKEFYYLDVSVPFKINEAITSWVDLSSVSIIPSHSWSAFSLCGSENSTLVMFGGDFGKTTPANLVFTYNAKTLQWSNPVTPGQPPNKHTRSVCDFKTGKMYMFSGTLNTVNASMDIFDTKSLAWGVGIYIGGVDSHGPIPLYNINDNTWSSMTTTGYLPTPRGHHSSVLTKDGRIIVYGGYIYRGTLVPVTDDLVVLDTEGSVFTWSKANVSTLSPPSRCYHSATMVDHYMIVAFGRNDLYLPSLTMNE
ncbi:21406_t:CDS:2 [Dentiscutata erythropus]|uniref:21406_t:CDS:1 n=1 Tax=Dentiscutata erythropus TaxID=1348616 RepID=A0A9N9EC28_9GLOM|nr:21406_t:CDS:2 [Dentiscutata erythropus]